jgi:hypothetical protein
MKGSFKRISYEDLLPDPFQRIRRVSCFSGLLFSFPPESAAASTAAGPPSGEPHRTPKDDTGGSGQIVPEYHIAPTGTEPPFCSCRVSPLSRPQPFFGKEITSLLLFYCLSLLCRVFYLVCVCNLEFKPFFLTILFVNPTPVTLELRFNSIPFVLRSHRACTSIVGGSREFQL